MTALQGLRIGSVTPASTLLLAACSGVATSPTTMPPGSTVSSPSNAPQSSASPNVSSAAVGVDAVGDCFDYTYADGVKDVWRYDALFMHAVGDHRPKVEVKRGILAVIRASWTVVHAVNDNPAVIALLESQRIPVTRVPGW